MQGASLPPWVQAVLGLALFLFYRMLDAMGAPPLYLWIAGSGVALAGIMIAASLIREWRWSRMLDALSAPTGLHGRMDFPVAADAQVLGLSFSNQDGNGIPLAASGGKIIYWHGKGHMSVRAPTEGGKTESSAANICFSLGPRRNIIATAKGPELAWLCGPYRQSLGQNVIVINPWRLMKDHGLPHHDFNPVGHLVKYARRGDAEVIDKARMIARILLPEPERDGGENKIFRSQGRDILLWSLVHLAVLEATTGELCCNPAFLYNMLCGDPESLKNFFREMSLSESFEGTLARAGARFLGKIEASPKSAMAFLTEAQDALQLYDPAGMLGRSVEYSDFDPADLKNPDRPTSIFIVIPPEKSLTHGSFAGLTLNSLIDICIEADRFEPRVTIIADEFANLSEGRLPAILPTLYIGRSRGVQLITYVQDTESYARYGREASAFTTQSEVILAWGIRSTKDAEEYSKRAGKRAVVAETGNLPVDLSPGHAERLSLGVAEKGVAHMRADEFMHLSDFTAVLIYRQNPPVITDLVSYRMVDPWQQFARPMPGGPPLEELPVKYRA